MAKRAKPQQVEFLNGEDGRWILVRGTDLAECATIAAEEAEANDMRVTKPDEVRLGWMRKIPCPGREHEIDGSVCLEERPGWHVIESKQGPGAFRGILAEVEYAEGSGDW